MGRFGEESGLPVVRYDPNPNPTTDPPNPNPKRNPHPSQVRPNSMNNYGVVLNACGFEQTMDALQRDCVTPLARLLFPRQGGDADHHHTFMVQYRHGEDLGLDMHTDASDVTLNVCLGKDFTGVLDPNPNPNPNPNPSLLTRG